MFAPLFLQQRNAADIAKLATMLQVLATNTDRRAVSVTESGRMTKPSAGMAARRLCEAIASRNGLPHRGKAPPAASDPFHDIRKDDASPLPLNEEFRIRRILGGIAVEVTEKCGEIARPAPPGKIHMSLLRHS